MTRAVKTKWQNIYENTQYAWKVELPSRKLYTNALQALKNMIWTLCKVATILMY